MKAETLITRLLQQRDSWCTLEPGTPDKPALEVLLRRPAETELPQYQPRPDATMQQLLTDAACRQAVDWRGFTEADILGPAHGSSDAVVFSAPLWAELLRDHAPWAGACAAHLMEKISQHIQQRAQAAKN